MSTLGDYIEKRVHLLMCTFYRIKKLPVHFLILLYTEGKAVPVHTMKAYGAIGI